MIKLQTKLREDDFYIKKYVMNNSNAMEHIATILFLIKQVMENTKDFDKNEFLEILEESMEEDLLEKESD